MEIFLATFQSIATLLGLGFIGFIIIARRIVPQNISLVLSTLAIDIALPLLVFENIITQFNPEKQSNWWLFPLSWAGFMLAQLVLTRLSVRFSGTKFPRELGMALFYQNATFVPLAIITGLWGMDSSMLSYLFLFTLFNATLLFSTYHLFFNQQEQKINLRKIVNNVLLATIVALLLSLTHLQLWIPKFVVAVSRMVGNMALPLLMFVLGGSIYIDFKERGKLYWGEILRFFLLKNILFPFVFIGLLWIIKPAPELSWLIFIESAVPPIISVSIFTQMCGGNRQIANQYLVASFLGSLVSIPFLSWIYSLVLTIPSM